VIEPSFEPLIVGDTVYSLTDIRNDGHIPDCEPDQLLALSGVRGVVVRVGHVEREPTQMVYLVQFETAAGELGVPVGCLPEELGILRTEASHEA
jgi:nitrogen fixation protein NifZ